MITFPGPLRENGQQNALRLTCQPIPIVRVAFIGLGKRGKEAVNDLIYVDGIQLVAFCDLSTDNVQKAQQILQTHGKHTAIEYTKPDDWKEICERSDIDLIIVCTQRDLHTPIAVYAMQCGKHVAIEVPAANTIDECWQLVNAAEQTRRHCIMLENCCYGAFELAVLNMAQQGLFGDIFHTEGAYIHDLRMMDFNQKFHYLDMWSMQGNQYQTHGLGPICQLLGIHREDKLAWLTSVSGGQFGTPKHEGIDASNKLLLGNINTTIIRTAKDKTIVLQHDISSPRPYSRNYLVSGTDGFVENRTTVLFAFSANGNKTLSAAETDELLDKYEHPFYRQTGELARKVGGHDGMDFIMYSRLIHCLRNGLPLDMDVYDAAEWSSIVELSSVSVTNGSVPVKIPDFTRGSAI